MNNPPRFPLVFWRLMRLLNWRMLSNYGPNSKAAGRVLVLTTLGRKSGKPRSTPLQYEEVEGVYYVTSARGVQADWYRNLVACPQADVQIGSKYFSTHGEPITDPAQIADFLEQRIQKHPRFMAVMLYLEGLPRKYTRTDLEKFVKRLAIVALRPDSSQVN